MKKIDIEFMYQQTLVKIQVKEADMQENERTERRRMFMSGFTECFMHIKDIGELDENEAVEILNQTEAQLMKYWQSQI